MFVVCIICTEHINHDQEVVVTTCGHCFHNSCISNWFNTSRTCATCRQPATASSLIKIFFENSDEGRIGDLHNDLLIQNSKLTEELDNLKQIHRLQNDELRETKTKLKTTNEELKSLERSKQCDDMALAGYRALKDDSEKEIIRLKEQVNNLALDLLAEKQLRRIHQTTLSKLESDNPNYDIATVLNEEKPLLAGEKNKHYSITPFWQLNCEATKTGAIPKEKEKSERYAVPRKIQKADTKPIQIQPTRMTPEFKFRHHYKSSALPTETIRPRSLSPVPAFSMTLTAKAFPQFQFGCSSSSTLPTSQNKNLFKFGEPSPGSSSTSNAFRNEGTQNGFQLLSSSSSSATQPSSSSNQNFPLPSNRYRDQASSSIVENTSTSVSPSSSTKKFSFAQKISDR